MLNQCNCIECEESESHCFCDCNLDELCVGCKEASENEKDVKFYIDCNLGRM